MMIGTTVKPTLGIIAGGGDLPARLIRFCKESSRPFFVLGFEGATDPHMLDGTPHAIVRLGAVGDALSYLHSADVKEVVMAGRIKRPSFGALMPDMTATKLLGKLGKAFFSGDDALLRKLVEYLEEEGFKVIGVEEVLTDLLMPKGVLTRHAPDEIARRDIEIGLRAARAIGALDIGQAVLVQNGIVLGVEAAEGTDEMIARCGRLRREDKGGVLVKVTKPHQESRVDLPAIGVTTVQRVHEAGFAGIACEAGGCILIGKSETIARADGLNMFIVGETLDEK